VIVSVPAAAGVIVMLPIPFVKLACPRNGRTQELFRCQVAFWWQFWRVIAMASEKRDRPRDLDLNGAQCYKYPEKTFAFPHRSLLDLD
jgi:hypothetical protein